jgi:hypothetical protein
VRTFRILSCLFLLLGACERHASEPKAEPSAELSAPEARAAPTHTQAALSPRLSRPAAETLVAIGDLHGDLATTRKALRLSGAIDESDHWVGGTRVVVQTGDAIDRGDQDREVLDLLERLRGEAKKAGGEFIPLSGNHELMNVERDFRYVTPASFAEFSSEQGRSEAFQPGGPYAKLLSERPILLKVGDTVFVHGGILSKHVAYGLDRMNDEVRAWMLGERANVPESVMEEEGPVWTRVYGGPQPDCEQLARVLAALDAKRMVVGHTVQASGINAACDGRVWRIDVGMSHFYGGPTQVLEIKGQAAKVLKETP